MARDCTVNKDPIAVNTVNKGFDSEYAQLMEELGEAGGGGGNSGGIGSGDLGRSGVGTDFTAGGSNVPPWRRPEVWQSNAPSNQQVQQTAYRPPAYGGTYGAYGAAGAGGAAPQWGAPPQSSAAGYAQPQDYQAAYAQYYQQQYNQQQQPPLGTPAQ
jgi:splicing factor 1